MAVHNGCNGSGRQVIEVTLGADRAWWSDWSSKPAGVRLDLGRFDSYTLPPRSVLFVSHPRDMAAPYLPQSHTPPRRPSAPPRGTTLAIAMVGSRGVSRAPVFAQS